MYILGINAYHPDSSACILKDGRLLAAVEEERFRRIKHWAGVPKEAIRYCLKEADIVLADIDYIGISRDPYVHLYKKILFALKRRPQASFIKSRLQNMTRVGNIKKTLCLEFSLSPSELKAGIYNIEHHKAHMASSFFVSGFKEAAVLSVDAMGDFVSTMFGYGKENKLKVLDKIFFPHSLGYLYTAATQFLGFLKFGDEYKVMGLAAYGKPNYLDKFKRILSLKKDGKFSLNLTYFRFYQEGIQMAWDNEEPVVGTLYSDKWIEEFGLSRRPDEELTQHHKDIAASVQAILEEAYFHILNYLYEKTRIKNLCLSGGVALNCVANGKIFAHTPFKDVYIQPAANDAGTCLGAAYYIYHQILKYPREFIMQYAYWGPTYSEEDISYELGVMSYELNKQECQLTRIKDEDELCKIVASAITEGKIVGWFQGRMEWGPRALGNRSILVDPRRPEMKDILNSRIKYREPFRPFAPSILEECAQEYFDKDFTSPFMLLSLSVKKEKVKEIIGSTHIDGTARVQTVDKKTNPLFWQLIDEFRKITGVPALLNTSFNENEPIVCKPKEAVDCFLRTKIDVLVMGNFVIQKFY